AEYFFPSPRLGVLLVPTEDVTAKLLYGRAFRAPTVRELLVEVQPDDDGFYAFTQGNLALEPEKIDTAEGEVAWRLASPVTLRGAAFASLLSEFIDKSIERDQYTNRGSALVVGGEAEVLVEAGPVDAAVSYAVTRGTTDDKRVYEFPPHMAHGRLTWSPVDRFHVTGMADWYGVRPRSEWSPDAGLSDGSPFGLLHVAVATDTLSDRLRVDLSVRNILDTPHQTLVYIDDANAVSGDAAKYPNDIDGEGRMFIVGLEADL
ncbi:MAG: TonB-dependent receptor, partial [Phycisphaeraceae bacterium]|nr:TonB-dependent receptor [Phycisphaeraceae bacterium]